MKTCKSCSEEKSISDFHRDKGKLDGYRSICKKCDHAKHQRYVEENRKHLSQYRQVWYRRNVEHVSKKNKASYLKFRARRLIHNAKKRAEKKSIHFDLDRHTKEIQSRIDVGFCEISGTPFNLDGGKTFDSPSIDRIDPKVGYVYANIRIVCFAMNCALNVWGEEVLWKIMENWKKKREAQD